MGIFIWLESQSTPTIALLMFAICYLMATLIFVVARALMHWRPAEGLKTTSPGMLSPIGVVTGLVIAFVASHVWSNLTSARAQLVREASAVRDVVLLADALPGDVRMQVRNGIKTYLKFIDDEDWPGMAKGSANIRRPPPGLTDVLTAVLGANVTGSGQQVAQQRIATAVAQALEARRQRILLSASAIEPTQWITIFTLASLMMMAIVFVHTDRAAAIGGLFVFASAVAACMVLLMASDRPFSAGGFTLSPEALHEVAPD